MAKFIMSSFQKWALNLKQSKLMDSVNTLNFRYNLQGAKPNNQKTSINRLNPQTVSKYGFPGSLTVMKRLLNPIGFHISAVNSKEIEYKEFTEMRKKLTVIDVRSSEDIKKTGTIPGSVNIPLAQVESALKRNADDFPIMYGRVKPTEDANLLFVCLKGSRAKQAQAKAVELGFENAMTFKGGWE